MSNLNVSVVQCELHWESPEENRSSIEKHLNPLSNTDVIVLPEMFTTGFSMRPEQIAEDHHSSMASLAWMQGLAEKHQAAITGSISVKEEGAYFNRMYWVEPEGKVVWYNKRHLFTFANEDDHYSPGTARVVVEWRGWKILLQVCYDLRFPVYMRNQIEHGAPQYDAAIFVANWPAVRSHPWKTLLLARAIENQCFVVASNRVGEDGNGISYSGDSAIIDPKGDYLIEAQPYRTQIIQHDLEWESLEAFRAKFPVLFDQ